MKKKSLNEMLWVNSEKTAEEDLGQGQSFLGT